jgi:A/G-specific adenine glycosylase
MLALATGEWASAPPAPNAGDWRELGEIEHVFTHFALTLRVFESETEAPSSGAEWASVAEAEAAMPSVFAKALRLSLRGR